VNSEIDGWFNTAHGHFALPWEGTTGDIASIEGDTARDIHIARFYLDTNEIHFLVPPEGGKAWELGLGLEQRVLKNMELVFLLRVRDVDRGGKAEEPIKIYFPPPDVGEPHPMFPLLRMYWPGSVEWLASGVRR
jgi:hypothetical protein